MTNSDTARVIAVALYDHVGGRSSEVGSYATDTALWSKIYQLSRELVEKVDAAVKPS